MTSRADLRRLAGSLSTLGTELEEKGERMWDVFAGWEPGPRPAPGPTNDDDQGDGAPNPAADDRREEMRQAVRAGEKLADLRAALHDLDSAQLRVIRLMDIACPPELAAVKNRRTGRIDPETPGDIAAAGYCVSCWRNDKQMVLREKAKKTGLYYSPTLCRWCADVKRAYNVEPPLEVLKLHHAGRRISVQAMEEAIAAAKQKGKGGSKKRRKGAA